MTLPIKTDERWPEGLVVDYAMVKAAAITGTASLYSIKDIAATWDVSEEFIKELEQDPEFIRQTRAEMMVIKKDAPHIAAKATMLLEAWLDQKAALWLADDEMSGSDRIKVIDQITKISGLLEKNKAVNGLPQEGTGGPVVPTLNIVLTTRAQVSVEKVVN